MKYFLLSFIIILTSCSFNNNSSYWNEDPLKKFLEKKNLSKILKKTGDFKKMTLEEFDIFLKHYSVKQEFPDINN